MKKKTSKKENVPMLQNQNILALEEINKLDTQQQASQTR